MAVSMPLIIDNRCNQNLIIALTSELRLPAIYPFRYYAENGGLSSYSVPWLLGRTACNGGDPLRAFCYAGDMTGSLQLGDYPQVIKAMVSVSSSINLPEHDVERAEDRRDIGEHVAAGEEIHR